MAEMMQWKDATNETVMAIIVKNSGWLYLDKEMSDVCSQFSVWWGALLTN